LGILETETRTLKTNWPGPGTPRRKAGGMESRGGNSTQLLGAIKMSRNSEIIIHTPSAVGSQETQDMAVEKRGVGVQIGGLKGG